MHGIGGFQRVFHAPPHERGDSAQVIGKANCGKSLCGLVRTILLGVSFLVAGAFRLVLFFGGWGGFCLFGENITGNHGGAGVTCCGASIQCVADGMPASYELRNKTHDHGDHQADGGQDAAQCAHYLVRTQNGIGVGEPLHHAQEQ